MISISPNKFTKGLAFVVLLLTLASIAGLFSKYYLGHDYLLGIVPLFDLSMESNIPSWYASSTLLLCAILLAVIALAKKKECASYVLHWIALSIVFLYLSLDEAISIHENWNAPVAALVDAQGFLFWAWVIPGMALVLIFALAYLRFLTALPAKTRRLFIVAGTVYVGGAIGMESVSARHFDFYGFGIGYEILSHVEEVLEMTGVLFFLYALLKYISSHVKGVTVCPDQEETLTRTN